MRELYDPNTYIEAADDAEMIQRAVDAAAETGERVVIPRHNLRTGRDIWSIPRAILLPSGTQLTLHNCHLRQETGVFDNLFRNANARTEAASTRAGRQYDIRIEGVGHAILDGGDHNGLVERNAGRDGRPEIIVNTMLHFHNCERVVLENLNILHQRWWGITFHYCAFSQVRGIRFMSVGNAPNADGIDLRTGCNNFLIENITGYTQDDTVALTCLDHGFDNRMRVENMDDSIHNVTVRNVLTASVCAQVRLLNHDGKRLYNVLIDNVQNACELDPADPAAAHYALRIPFSPEYVLESGTTAAMEPPYWGTFEGTQQAGASVRIGDDAYYKEGNPENAARLGDTYNITVRNVQSHAKYGVTVSCTLCDALIENVQMYGDSLCPVYFGPGLFEGIRIRDIGSAWNAAPAADAYAPIAEDWGRRYGIELPACVYFNGSRGRALCFDGVRAGRYVEAVFAGHAADVQLRARNVEVRSEAALIGGDGIRIAPAEPDLSNSVGK